MTRTARQIGRANKRAGAVNERAVQIYLELLGLKCVDRIEQGYRLVFHRNPQTGAVVPVKWFPLPKARGDFFCLGPDGRGVVVEAKRTSEPKLSLAGHFKEHQPDALDAWVRAGGLAFVAWGYDNQMALLRWPIVPLGHGAPLSWLAAKMLNVTHLRGGA